jgi:hypothetical protein
MTASWLVACKGMLSTLNPHQFQLVTGPFRFEGLKSDGVTKFASEGQTVNLTSVDSEHAEATG